MLRYERRAWERDGVSELATIGEQVKNNSILIDLAKRSMIQVLYSAKEMDESLEPDGKSQPRAIHINAI
jgi:hypothetical protein